MHAQAAGNTCRIPDVLPAAGEILKEIRSWVFPKPLSDSTKLGPRIPPVEFSRKDRMALSHTKTQGELNARLLSVQHVVHLIRARAVSIHGTWSEAP